MRRARGLTRGAAVVVVGALAQIVTNFAAETPPAWLADPVRNWLIVLVLALLLVLLTPEQQAPPDNALPAVPRFGGVSVSLRPPALDHPLQGREAELDRLRALSRAPAGRFAVVCAGGGMGKTTLAAEFARRARSEGLAAFWIRYQSASELGGQFEEIAVATGLPPARLAEAQHSNADVTGLVWDHLDRVPGWVIVLDNLDQIADAAPAGEALWEYRGWIRPSFGGLLLVTSRDRHPETWGTAAVRIILGPLPNAEGAQVLCEAAPDAGSADQAAALSARLGGLPLALRAAGAVLAEPTSRYRTFTAYRQALANCGASLMPEAPDAVDPDVARTLVGHTWDLSLDQLTTSGITLAAPVLQLLSQFGDAPIPRSLLTPELLATVIDDAATWAAVDAAVAGLHRFGLIELPDPARTLDIPTVALHPVVREATAARLSQEGRAAAYREVVNRVLAAAVRQAVQAQRSGWSSAQLLAPHLAALYDPNTSAELSADTRDVLDDLAKVLADAGRPHTELTLRQIVLAAAQRVLGPDHPDTLRARHNLTDALVDLVRFQEAADLHRETLAAREPVLGPAHPDILRTRSDLASSLHGLGHYQQAADLQRETLADMEQVLGLDHHDTQRSRNSLGSSLSMLSREQEAADLYRSNLASRERVLGPDHPDTLLSRHNLAVVLGRLGRYQEAVDLHRTTLAAHGRVLGPEHPSTLWSRSSLAAALNRLGHAQEAADLQRDTLAVMERVLGLENVGTIRGRANLADALHSLGRYQEAADLHRDTLTARERIFGPDHPDTLSSRSHLASALEGLGRHEEAADLHRDTLTARERILGPDHPDTIQSRNDLAAATAASTTRQHWRKRRRGRPTA